MTDLEVPFRNQLFIQGSKSLNGALRFKSENAAMLRLKPQFLDQFDCLSNWSSIVEFEQEAKDAGMSFTFVGDARERYESYRRWVTEQFEVDSPFLKEHSLYGFQHIGLNMATDEQVGRVMAQWDTGAGKTLLGSLATLKLFDLDLIDIALIICKRAKKIDWEDYVKDVAPRLRVVRPEGSRAQRHKLYAESDAQVFVLNFEKIRMPQGAQGQKNKSASNGDWSKTDLWQILQMTNGKRVLIVVDEAQKIGNRTSLISKGLKGLTTVPSKGPGVKSARIIALTATPYATSPLNYRDIFNTLVPGLPLVACNKQDFQNEYTTGWNIHAIEGWDPKKLPRLGRRIERHCHVAMKSDPRIAAQFPAMTEREISIEMSERDREVYEATADAAWDVFYDSAAASMVGFGMMRMVCNSAESLLFSQSKLAEAVRERTDLRFTTTQSAKFEAVQSLCEKVLETNDKIVLFSYWANAVIPPYMRELQKMGAPVYRFIGDDSTDEQARNKDQFNAARGGAIMVMSDAGQEGINLYAPYLAHIEMPYTYLGYKQRRDRIHRSDSIAKGIEHIWVYRFITTDSVEERVAQLVSDRKNNQELIQGTPDAIMTEERLDRETLYRVMFGNRAKPKKPKKEGSDADAVAV